MAGTVAAEGDGLTMGMICKEEEDDDGEGRGCAENMKMLDTLYLPAIT